MAKIPNINCYIHDGNEYTIKGRLLGICTKQEKNEIETNFKIANRVFTKASTHLSEIVERMLDISSTTKGNNAGNLVIAIKTINNINVYTKTLMITSALTLILEEETTNDYSKIEAQCEDGSYLIIEDIT